MVAPKVSVVVPVYNVEKYLSYCLESIAAQTEHDIEIIVVDDGSTDNSGKICDEFCAKDPRVRVFHKPNEGAASARNAGVDDAHGEYISFVDADDRLEPDFLEEMTKAMEMYDADLVCCGFLTGVKPDGTHKSVVCPDGVKQYDRKQGLIEMIAPDGFWGTLWNKIYKREIIERAGITFPTHLTFCEDRVFLNKYILNCSKVIYLPKILYRYCISEDSLCRRLATSGFVYKEIDAIKAEQINCSAINELGDEELANGIKGKLFHKNDSIMNRFLNHYNGDKETLNYFRNNFEKYAPYCNSNPRFPRVSRKHLCKDRLKLQFPHLSHYLHSARQKLKTAIRKQLPPS